MNEKPTPSEKVLNALGQALFDEAHAHCACPRRWDEAAAGIRSHYRVAARAVLAPVMPQLSADVLHHAADELNLVSADEWTRGDCVNWLRRQAEAVLT